MGLVVCRAGNGIAVTTFDRYLLRRFWHVFGIGFFATLGLYVVFDGFTNVDAFQKRTDAGGTETLVVLERMAQFYVCQATVIFDLVAPILTVVSTMVVFALLQKNRELHPILDRKSTRLNSSHGKLSRMPSSA